MKGSELFELSRQMRQAASKVLTVLNIADHCKEVKGSLNIVGSLKTDLMLNHRDIDLHFYTSEPMVEKSFAFMKGLAENNAIKDIQYKNLLDTKEECIEWHLWYEAEEGISWKLDIIHIRKGSFYDGFFEAVTDKVIQKLTHETKEIILQIKYELGEKSNVPGIQIYHAVLEHGVKNCTDFIQWQKENPLDSILEWVP
jgi:hypothetical protein